MKTTEAQCLIDDGDGNVFLCPHARREDAQQYFDTTIEGLADPEYMPPPLPEYLKEIPSIDQLVFENARFAEKS